MGTVPPFGTVPSCYIRGDHRTKKKQGTVPDDGTVPATSILFRLRSSTAPSARRPNGGVVCNGPAGRSSHGHDEAVKRGCSASLRKPRHPPCSVLEWAAIGLIPGRIWAATVRVCTVLYGVIARNACVNGSLAILACFFLEEREYVARVRIACGNGSICTPCGCSSEHQRSVLRHVVVGPRDP